MPLGPWELGIILLIIVIIFGVGRLPEIGGALGRGIKEFKTSTKDEELADDGSTTTVATTTKTEIKEISPAPTPTNTPAKEEL
jgi:sec-independent protein translocase protein TatA